jgi:hypothetical protein
MAIEVQFKTNFLNVYFFKLIKQTMLNQFFVIVELAEKIQCLSLQWIAHFGIKIWHELINGVHIGRYFGRIIGFWQNAAF